MRKLSGFSKPSKANEAAFDRAVEKIAECAGQVIGSLETHAPPRDREEEALKAKLRAAQRFAV